MSTSTPSPSGAAPSSSSNQPPSTTPIATSNPTDPTTTKAKGTGTFTLLLFGPAQSYCDDTEQLHLAAPTTLSQAFDELESRFKGFGEKILRVSQVVVNLEYVDWEWGGKGGEREVKVGDEVGIVPPVSAG